MVVREVPGTAGTTGSDPYPDTAGWVPLICFLTDADIQGCADDGFGTVDEITWEAAKVDPSTGKVSNTAGWRVVDGRWVKARVVPPSAPGAGTEINSLDMSNQATGNFFRRAYRNWSRGRQRESEIATCGRSASQSRPPWRTTTWAADE